MNDDPQTKWNQRYAQIDDAPQAAAVLQQNHHLLPRTGVALDLACGLGGNALLLARHGLHCSAWDVSNVAVEKLRKVADLHGLSVEAQVRDVVHRPPAPRSFDVIVVSRFLHRPLVPFIVDALKPCGLVFYQTFIQDKPVDIGPSNPDYLLAENELLRLFSGMRILLYREEGQVGNTGAGFRGEALLVAQNAAGHGE